MPSDSARAAARVRVSRGRVGIPLTEASDYEYSFWLERLKGKPTYVYVLSGVNGMVKIGHSNTLVKRIKQLQTGHPAELVLLHALPADEDLERYWHKRLAPARQSGEWFDGPLVTDFLAEMSELGRNLRDWYKDDGQIPNWRQFVKDAPRKRHRSTRVTSDISVRHVAPDPVMPPEEAAVLRESLRHTSPAMYLGPQNTRAQQRISRHPAYNKRSF